MEFLFPLPPPQPVFPQPMHIQVSFAFAMFSPRAWRRSWARRGPWVLVARGFEHEEGYERLTMLAAKDDAEIADVVEVQA